MDRQTFLQQHWSPYPSAKDFPPDLQVGRVLQRDASGVRLRREQEDLQFSLQEIAEGVHPSLGPSVRGQWLQRGDWVGWLPSQKQMFMLSPCWAEKAPLFDAAAAEWSEFLQQVEQFFLARRFHHLRTPFLVTSPGVDHHIDFMEVTASKTGRRWALPTSPEIHLKKSLCQGYQRVFEVKSCFRDDLPGPQHSAEFTMLEWYRAFASLNEIRDDLCHLLQALSSSSLQFHNFTLAEAFQRWVGVPLTPATSLTELQSWAQEQQVDFSDSDDWNDLFFRIFMEKVEPHLGQDGPTLLYFFPPQQASLAQINKQGWAERFELYWKGVELANAYLEVNDPWENRRRFAREERLRQGAEKDLASIDEEFFEYLESGMPPASGIALGLDRLYRLLGTPQ